MAHEFQGGVRLPRALVLVHGDPVRVAVQGTKLERAVNTRALLLKEASGRICLHLLDGFLTATDLAGPWSVATKPPSGAAEPGGALAKEEVVDLMEGSPDEMTHARPTPFAGVPVVVSAAHRCYAPTPCRGAMPYDYRPPIPCGTAYGAYGGAATWGPADVGGDQRQHVQPPRNDLDGLLRLGRLQRVLGHRADAGRPFASASNAYTVGLATVSGPGGQSTSVAQVNNLYDADHNGNTYSYNSSTGQSQKYSSSHGGGGDGGQTWGGGGGSWSGFHGGGLR